MKIKILLLLIIPLLLTGCYDYQEITNLGITVALGIDYQNDEYVITYELLEDNKDKQSGVTSSYTVTASDKILAKAFSNTESKVAKKAYYSHIDIVLFSKSIASNHFQEVTDYLLRNKDIREDFNAVVVDNPQNILNSTDSKLKVISSAIDQTLTTNKYEKKYSDVINDILTYGLDTSIPVIEITDNNIIIDGLAIFNNYNLVNYLDSDYTDIYYIVSNQKKQLILNNSKFNISIYNPQINIKMHKDIIITGKVNAEILDNKFNYDLKNPQVINSLEKEFTNILNTKIKELLFFLQNNKSDILGITNNYYQMTRNKNDLLWFNSDINTKVKVIISKKGIIYEVKHD